MKSLTWMDCWLFRNDGPLGLLRELPVNWLYESWELVRLWNLVQRGGGEVSGLEPLSSWIQISL